MKRMRFLLLAACSALAACASPRDTVIFVTNTSFGVTVESKPPAASIAYDRTEGYVAPRTADGGIPPVVASIQTSGDIFKPDVRTAYATGDAAGSIVSPVNHQPCDPAMTAGDNKMAFFGTATTVGLKAGFDPTSGAPDSFVFGVKRTELSVIPLGNIGGRLVYPSVLASLDTTGRAPSLSGTGLTIDQYFATGCAAEILAATNQTVRQTFATITANAVSATLTADQRAAAQAQANAIIGAQTTNLDKVMNAVAPGGTLNKGSLDALIDRANSTGPSLNALKDATSADQLRSWIASNPAVTARLAAAAGG